MSRWTLALVASALLSGTVSALDPVSKVVTEHAWIRAMPPFQANTAAYVSMTNHGSVALELTGATVGLADRVEIHTSMEVDGYVRMQKLDSVPLAPGQTLHLAPGGIHLMVMGLGQGPVDGSSSRLCLIFSSGQPACVEAPVRRSTSDNEPQHKHH